MRIMHRARLFRPPLNWAKRVAMLQPRIIRKQFNSSQPHPQRRHPHRVYSSNNNRKQIRENRAWSQRTRSLSLSLRTVCQSIMKAWSLSSHRPTPESRKKVFQMEMVINRNLLSLRIEMLTMLWWKRPWLVLLPLIRKEHQFRENRITKHL